MSLVVIVRGCHCRTPF